MTPHAPAQKKKNATWVTAPVSKGMPAWSIGELFTGMSANLGLSLGDKKLSVKIMSEC